MLSLVWCPPGWCCGQLYLVADLRAWRCPYSGVDARTVVAEFDGLVWSKPGKVRRFFIKHRDNLGRRAKACAAGVGSLIYSDGPAEGLKQGKRMYGLLRCIVGDLFRPVLPFSPAILAWNGGIVTKLANCVYRERDFTPERMGILADALEEAGVIDQDVLGHLRGPGPHCWGCHILDALLEKR